MPIVRFRQGPRTGELEYVELLGTCFLLADSGGLAMTAKHVSRKITVGEAAVMFTRNGTWQPAAVQGVEEHRAQDVALLRLEPGDYPSPFSLSRFRAHASSQYMVWGYPEAILREGEPGRGGVILERPDLAYSEGHIRRRLTGISLTHGPLGTRFYELSAIAGDGCSGGPVTLRTPNMPWSVVGVYVGERRMGLPRLRLTPGLTVCKAASFRTHISWGTRPEPRTLMKGLRNGQSSTARCMRP